MQTALSYFPPHPCRLFSDESKQETTTTNKTKQTESDVAKRSRERMASDGPCEVSAGCSSFQALPAAPKGQMDGPTLEKRRQVGHFVSPGHPKQHQVSKAAGRLVLRCLAGSALPAIYPAPLHPRRLVLKSSRKISEDARLPERCGTTELFQFRVVCGTGSPGAGMISNSGLKSRTRRLETSNSRN